MITVIMETERYFISAYMYKINRLEFWRGNKVYFLSSMKWWLCISFIHSDHYCGACVWGSTSIEKGWECLWKKSGHVSSFISPLKDTTLNWTDLITSCCSGKEPWLVDWTWGTGRNWAKKWKQVRAFPLLIFVECSLKDIRQQLKKWYFVINTLSGTRILDLCP